jgi:hypothetical protein
MKAIDMINESIKFDKIVKAEYSETLATDLFFECDDQTWNDNVCEFIGHNWRVHLIDNK